MQVEAADNCGGLCQAKQLLLPGPSMEPWGSFVGIAMGH